MKDALFDSSDRLRSATPLRHAQQAVFTQPLRLELGGQLPSVSVTYETYGQLNDSRDNAVLVCHAISGDSHVARHDADDDPGWWELIVGPGKSIDTDRYFVICSNVLGGCRGTTGPNSVNPSTGRPYGADFPAITVDDMVEVQRRLIDHLDIAALRAVIGGSLGGHQALTWAIRHPERVRGCVALATSARLTSQALAFDVVGRNAIMHDPGYRGGQYYEHGAGPVVGLALARMLAHITYLSREAMRAKFDPRRLQPSKVATAFENKFAVGSYLAYQGHKFVERFDPNSYVTLSMAMDLFDLGDTREQLRAVFARSQCRWLVISFSSDWLFPPEQSRQIVAALIAANHPVAYCNVEASGGHDAFLLEEKRPLYGGLMREFLAHVDGCLPPAMRVTALVEAHANAPTSIFHGHRLDYDRILELIPAKASVLDLGCGSGGLLSQLRERGHTRLVGVDLDEDALLACVAQGLDVVQCDIEKGLSSFSDKQFDVVVLSQTLQSVSNTEGVVDEMLRVGRSCIVSFPNFAYRKLRQMLSAEGRSPKAQGAYHFEWYNTPNRRFPSIADVEDFCVQKGIHTHRKLYLNSETGQWITVDPNLEADIAIFVLSR
ncbi:MAG TPA: homoserine O-acetyltransferase [Candidatus Margulisiibacteriota bacterium]|nr:homoserine O-acetyltransferase [Candidatus Margulisiibacteriota bacterium]